MADPLLDRIMTFDLETQRGLTAYVRRLFAPEDEALIAVRRNTPEKGLPEIQIRPEEGQILQFLMALIGAKRVLEIGTLAGYSGIWLARGLPPDGRLVTLELEPRHAAVAREHFRLAGVADRIEIMVGDALASLKQLAAAEPFDMVFIDADKHGYPAYLAWSVDHIRPGGLITFHNAFRGGKLLDAEPDEQVTATREALDRLAHDARLFGTLIPVGDGIGAALVKPRPLTRYSILEA